MGRSTVAIVTGAAGLALLLGTAVAAERPPLAGDARGTPMASAADEDLIRYRTKAKRLQLKKQMTPSGRCKAPCFVWRFSCSVDCSFKTTTRIVLPGADVVTRIPGSADAGVIKVVIVTPLPATRRKIKDNFKRVKLKTKLKGRGNLGGLDTDRRVFRLKR